MTFLFALAALVASAQAPAAKEKAAGAPEAGKKIFAAKCATCHGKDAKGSPGTAKMFGVDKAKLDLVAGPSAKKTDAELAAVIKSGEKKMPSFKGRLTETELAGVVAFLRTLAPLAVPATKPAETK